MASKLNKNLLSSDIFRALLDNTKKWGDIILESEIASGYKPAVALLTPSMLEKEREEREARRKERERKPVVRFEEPVFETFSFKPDLLLPSSFEVEYDYEPIVFKKIPEQIDPCVYCSAYYNSSGELIYIDGHYRSDGLVLIDSEKSHSTMYNSLVTPYVYNPKTQERVYDAPNAPLLSEVNKNARYGVHTTKRY